MVTFRQTLQRFVAVLKRRKVDDELGIVIKDPSEFTVEYILEITNKIGESRENSMKTKSCKSFIRKCYRKVEDNRGVIGGILTMVPDDVYGSVISGGCSLILAVRHVWHKGCVSRKRFRMRAHSCPFTRPSRSMLSNVRRSRAAWQRSPRSWRPYSASQRYTTRPYDYTRAQMP
jgi:hypothetical protein